MTASAIAIRKDQVQAVQNLSGNLTLLASQTGGVWSNVNATAVWEVTLPTAVPGLSYTIIRDSGVYPVRLVPEYPNQMWDGPVRGYYFWEAKTRGAVKVVCHKAGEWVMATKTADGYHPYFESETYYVDPVSGSDSNTGLTGSPKQTLLGAFKVLQPGDILILENGTYSGSSNAITQEVLPRGLPSYEKTPVLTTDNSRRQYWITIKARNFGLVKITADITIFPYGGDLNYAHVDDYKFYVQFDGIIWSALTMKQIGGQYLKFFKCGFRGAPGSGNVQTVMVSGGNEFYRGAKNILMEDCFAWGPGGRYKFIAFNAENVIFRRCIARSDTVGWTQPGSGLGSADFVEYDSVGVEFQNCISLDSQAPVAGNQGWYGCFVANNNDYWNADAAFRGCMVLNAPGNGFVSTGLTSRTISTKPTDQATFSMRKVPKNILFEHCAGVSLGDVGGGYGFAAFCGEVTVRNMTIAHMAAAGSVGYFVDQGRWTRGTRVLDSIFSSVLGLNFVGYPGWLPENMATFLGSTAIALTVADGLKYLPRVEAGDDLENAGQGATILLRYGTSGTMYGDPGSVSLGHDAVGDLWPMGGLVVVSGVTVTVESVIKTAMSNAGGYGDTDRGWTSTGDTLSEYVWKSLGQTTVPV